MFDRVPEQFHQFIATRNSLPLHPSLPPFDAYNHPSHHHHHHLPLPPAPPNLLSPLHQKDEQHKQQQNSMNFEINEREPRLGEHDLIDSTSWTEDEVLTLLRIRSDLDTWFPELTWEHVSRKLAELGFKRSAEKCKEKFEEETSYFNNIPYVKNSGYRFMSELEQLYEQQESHQIAGVEVEVGSQESNKQPPEKPAEEHHGKMDHPLEDGSANDDDEGATVTHKCEETTVKMAGTSSKRNKRKRSEKFEMLKGFCENMVNKMMAKQEQMHNKLLEDMIKRDQEIFARHEAWKKQEMDGMNWELEMMAKEQAVSGQRQAAIIDLLKKISDQSQYCTKTVPDDPNPNPNSLQAASPSSNSQNPKYTGESNPEPPPPPRVVINCTSEGASDEKPDSSSEVPNPNSSNDCNLGAVTIARNPNSVSEQSNEAAGKADWTENKCMRREREEMGRRWPREEVVALINLRSSANEEREGGGGSGSSGRVPLWERISEGMKEMGYNRSAKRCKEKWENINKYFRKTKHLSKKRSMDSRTCPYFHQLTSLYSQ